MASTIAYNESSIENLFQMFLSTPSASFNLTSIEKKLAAIETTTTTTTSSSAYTVKPTHRLTKVNNENELDAHLKSERAAFNDELFEYLTQQVLLSLLKSMNDCLIIYHHIDINE